MPSREYYRENKERILERARERYDPKLRKLRYQQDRERILSALKVKRHFQRQEQLEYETWREMIAQQEAHIEEQETLGINP